MADHGGGSIVNIASVAGQVAVKRRFAYGASKGAVIAMTKSMAIDLVDSRHPGELHLPGHHLHAIRRRLSQSFSCPQSRGNACGLHARQPLGRMGRPEEVAYAALYLASAEAEFATERPGPRRRPHRAIAPSSARICVR